MKTFKQFIEEAVGDPINAKSVFKLSDPTVQKNLQSALKPAGPPPMSLTKPKKEKASFGDYARGFVGRMIRNTITSPIQ